MAPLLCIAFLLCIASFLAGIAFRPKPKRPSGYVIHYADGSAEKLSGDSHEIDPWHLTVRSGRRTVRMIPWDAFHSAYAGGDHPSLIVIRREEENCPVGETALDAALSCDDFWIIPRDR